MNSKILITITGVFLLLACAKQGHIAVDIRCENDIKLASNKFQKLGNELDKSTANQLSNLIKAAKIQQQHQRFVDCSEKAQRAIDLMQGIEKSTDTNKS